MVNGNLIAETAEVVGAENMTPDQIAQAVSAQTMAIIEKASLKIIEERYPEKVEYVKDLIDKLDFRDLMTIAQAGASAMEGQKQIGLDIIAALQQGPGQEAIAAVSKFEKDLKARIQPFQNKMNDGAGKGIVRTLFRKVRGLLTSTDKEKEAEKEALRQEKSLMAEIVENTTKDAAQVFGIINLQKHVPLVVQSQVNRLMSAQADKALEIYFNLASVNEYQKLLVNEIIPDLQKRVTAEVSMVEDIDDLQQAQDAMVFIERRRASFTQGLLTSNTHRTMAREISHLNVMTASQYEALETDVMANMVTDLSMLVLQQTMAEHIQGEKEISRMSEAATNATVAGFNKVVQQRIEADDAILSSQEAVVRAASTTLKIIENFREHECLHIVKQQAMLKRLTQSIGDMSAAAVTLSLDTTRIGASQGKAIPTRETKSITDAKYTDKQYKC